jgi:site-specific recombinase
LLGSSPQLNDLPIERSPFYALVFATETFITSENSEPPMARMERWLEAVYACRGTIAIFRLNMEDAGVSTALVFDLSAMDASLDRMEMLTATMVEHTQKPSIAARHAPWPAVAFCRLKQSANR